MIAIIDYEMGNIFSVENALMSLGASVCVSNKSKDIIAAEKIILPGVGSFPAGMKNLDKLGLLDVLRGEVLQKKKPILGICLGMQLLATEGEEHGFCQGLDFVKGKVRKFKNEIKLSIPHVGWDDVNIQKNSLLYKGVEKPVFYFVHSYHFVPVESSIVTGHCDYGERFVASLEKNNIFGTQFHPEKSQRNGLLLLKNFIEYKNA